MVAKAHQAGVGQIHPCLASFLGNRREALVRKNHRLIHDITTDVEYTTRVEDDRDLLIALGYDPGETLREERVFSGN